MRVEGMQMAVRFFQLVSQRMQLIRRVVREPMIAGSGGKSGPC